MAWIEFHAARIKRLKKFQDFRKDVGWSTIEALGFLGSFWGEVIELAEDGDITGWNPEYVAELTGLKASPERVWEALASNGWIDRRDGKVIVHDWLDASATYLRGKYSKDNRQRLVEIWAIHGRSYGNPMGNPSELGCTVPDLTLPTKPTSNTAPPAPRPRFVKPTPKEVTAYAASIGFRLDGERFCAHYESKGWMIGKSPMKNWKSAVVTWKKDAPITAIIQAPKAKTADPDPKDCISAEDIRGLLSSIGKEVPR